MEREEVTAKSANRFSFETLYFQLLIDHLPKMFNIL